MTTLRAAARPTTDVLDRLGLPGHVTLVDLALGLVVLVALVAVLVEVVPGRRATGREGRRWRRREGAHRAKAGPAGRRPRGTGAAADPLAWTEADHALAPSTGSGAPGARRLPDTVTAGRPPA